MTSSVGGPDHQSALIRTAIETTVSVRPLLTQDSRFLLASQLSAQRWWLYPLLNRTRDQKRSLQCKQRRRIWRKTMGQRTPSRPRARTRDTHTVSPASG